MKHKLGRKVLNFPIALTIVSDVYCVLCGGMVIKHLFILILVIYIYVYLYSSLII